MLKTVVGKCSTKKLIEALFALYISSCALLHPNLEQTITIELEIEIEVGKFYLIPNFYANV